MRDDLTDDERRAIASLRRLAKRWPKSLQLFSWSGSLKVLKIAGLSPDADANDAIVESINGIPNGGGDPYRVRDVG